MDLTVTTLEGKDAGKISLSDAIFGLDPRQDLIQRIVRWQLAKKQQGGHKTLMVRLFAATSMIFPRRFALWLCVMRFRPRHWHPTSLSLTICRLPKPRPRH